MTNMVVTSDLQKPVKYIQKSSYRNQINQLACKFVQGFVCFIIQDKNWIN